jgi:hypothetical protein
MGQPGKKKTGGNRYSSGRKRPPKPEDAREVAIEARKRVFGVSDDDARHTEVGYTLGRLYKRGLLPDPRGANSRQAANLLAAGNEFAETMRLFMLSAGLGSPTPVALDPNRVRGRGGDKPVMGQSKARLYCDALKEVDRINYQLVKCKMPSAWEMVWQVCVCERDETLFPMTPAELGVLREGLNAIYRMMGQTIARAA